MECCELWRFFFYFFLGDVGHIEKDETSDDCENNSGLQENIDDPHHIVKQISQIQPVTTIKI